MLELKPVAGSPAADDWCFPFSEHSAIGSLSEPPGFPWRRAALEAAFPGIGVGVAIGWWQGAPAYGVEVADPALIDPMQHAGNSLFKLLGRVDDELFAAHGRALQLLRWRRENRFCGVCGTAMGEGDGGRARVCPSCGHTSYPKLAPCAIVLVTRGPELLLAQAQGRGPGFYSTLAGFIEPGESAEQAVAREVHEEVGIKVQDIRYFGSQPWPFPGQLMLGFFARYAGGEIMPDPTEIADAQWFMPDSLPPVPPGVSIAGQLIEHFVEQEARRH